jgi:branched-chain amino acid transport system ATP-binding protein
VLVEQNLVPTLSLAERVYTINNGHIAFEGPASEINAHPDADLSRYLGLV